MAEQIIDVGTSPNSGTGDPLRTAFVKTDDNFNQIWAAGPVGSNVRIQGNTISTLQVNQDLALSPNGVGNVRLNNNTIPGANNTWFLGSVTNRWRGLYVGNVNTANLSVTGNVSLPGLGNITIPGGSNGYVLSTDGAGNLSWVAQGGAGNGNPGGANTQIQFNDSGLFGGSASLTWDSGNAQLNTVNFAASDATIYGNVNAINGNFTGNVTANYFVGDGSLLTGINTGVTIANTAPALGNGGVWWNSVDGRAYVKYANAFIDLSPSLVPDPTTYVGNVSFDDITVTNVGNVIPAANVTYSLGSAAFQWSNLWVANNTIYLGGVPLGMTAGNVLTVNGNTITGNVTFGDQIVIGTGISNVVGGLYLSPSPSSANALQYLRVRGDVSYEPTHIHFDTGNNQYFNQFIGDDNKYVLLSNVGNIVIRTDDYAGNSAQWTFGNDGALTFPAGSKISNYPGYPGGDSWFVTPPSNAGGVASADGQQYVQVNNGYGVEIGTGWPGNAHAWYFGTDGNLTLPSNTFAVNYANGDPVSLGGNYGDSNVVSLMGAFGSNTVSTTGNITAGNFVGAGSNVDIVAGSYDWTFGNDGTLLLPRDASGNTDPYLWITGGPAPSISSVDVSLAGPANFQIVSDYLNLSGYTGAKVAIKADNGEIATDANMVLTTNGANVGNTYSWTFDIDGTLTTPGNITGANVVSANTFVSNAFNVVTAGNLSITSQYGLGFTGTILEDNGTLELIGSGGGAVVAGWDSTYGNGLGNIATINFNEVGGEGIVLRTGNRAATEYNWNFDSTGNLTLPTEGYLLVQTGIIGAGASPAPTLSGFSSIATTGVQGNISASGNLLAAGYANITGNINGSGAIFSGNVTAGNFIGNGSQLTAVNAVTVDVTNTNGLATTYYPTFVENRTTAQIARADVDLSYRTDTNTLTVGNISSGGNITAAYFIGNGSALTGVTVNTVGNITGTSSNVDIIAGAYQWTFNNTGNLVLPGNTFAVNYANGTAVALGGGGGSGTVTNVQGAGTVSGITLTGNVTTTGNLTLGGTLDLSSVSGNITTSGNISGGYILGNGSQLTGLPASYTNSNVTTLLASFGSNTISTTGNITAGNFIGNGSQLTGVANLSFTTVSANGTSVVADSTADTLTFTPGNNLVITGNATSDTVTFAVSDAPSFTGNVTAGNLITTGNVSGNVNGFAIGYRDIPVLSLAANTTVSTSDAGKQYYSTSASALTLTIANNASQAFQTGATINIINQGAGNVSVLRGVGVTMYLAGNSTSSDRTLTSYGVASVTKVATDTWFISGVGLV